MKKTLILLLAGSFILASCRSKEKALSFVFDAGGENGTINSVNLIPDTLNPGNNISYIDSAKPYGFGYATILDKDLANKKIKIKVSAKVKCMADQDGGIVVALDGNGKNIEWKSFGFAFYGVNKDAWTEIKDSITVDAAKNTVPNSRFTAYPWKDKNTGMVLIDDLKLEVSETK
jgi:hypothetical protein